MTRNKPALGIALLLVSCLVTFILYSCFEVNPAMTEYSLEASLAKDGHGNYVVLFVFTNTSAGVIHMYEHDLPWGGYNSLMPAALNAVTDPCETQEGLSARGSVDPHY